MTAPPSAATTSDTVDLIFQLIASAYRTPGDPLRDDLASGAWAEAVAALAADLDLSPPPFEHVAFEDLRERHVALFVANVAGVAAPPYVGYAVDDELLGDTFQALGATFARCGIEVSDDWRDLPDHVSAVAEGGLLLLEADRSDDAYELLVRYLAPWFARFAPTLAVADGAGFYGSLTSFLDTAIGKVTHEAAS